MLLPSVTILPPWVGVWQLVQVFLPVWEGGGQLLVRCQEQVHQAQGWGWAGISRGSVPAEHCAWYNYRILWSTFTKNSYEGSPDLLTPCFIGATDKEREGSWKWIDGSPWTWGGEENKGNKEQNCLEMTVITNKQGLNMTAWSGVDCEKVLPRSFICSFKKGKENHMTCKTFKSMYLQASRSIPEKFSPLKFHLLNAIQRNLKEERDPIYWQASLLKD